MLSARNPSCLSCCDKPSADVSSRRRKRGSAQTTVKSEKVGRSLERAIKRVSKDRRSSLFPSFCFCWNSENVPYSSRNHELPCRPYPSTSNPIQQKTSDYLKSTVLPCIYIFTSCQYLINLHMLVILLTSKRISISLLFSSKHCL